MISVGDRVAFTDETIYSVSESYAAGEQFTVTRIEEPEAGCYDLYGVNWRGDIAAESADVCKLDIDPAVPTLDPATLLELIGVAIEDAQTIKRVTVKDQTIVVEGQAERGFTAELTLSQMVWH